MSNSGDTHEKGAKRRIDGLLRGAMMVLFATGALAIGALWGFESKFGLIDEVCKILYPLMLAIFIASAVMLYRWPTTVPIARWIGFGTMTGFLVLELLASMSIDGPLLGNYAFISVLMWLPLAYAIALFMLDARQAAWAAGGLFALIAAMSLVHIMHSASNESGDKALLVNLLISHVVLLACLSGLVKIRLVLFKAEAHSRRLMKQASTDPLTGLANRRFGLEMLRLAASEHTAETSSAVILCDIDHFKEINDSHGHDVGDQVVLAIASVLEANTREIDTVVRWGGDEFLVVVPQIGKPALTELAERLRMRSAETRLSDEDGRSVAPSLSFGIAEMADDEALEAWIKRADKALYLAKAGGRNRCVFAPLADPESGSPDALSGLSLLSELE